MELANGLLVRNTCTCGVTFLDAEDWRDHMPCPGSATEQAFEAGAAVAFAIIGMAEAIRERYAEPRCERCGRSYGRCAVTWCGSV